MNNAYGLQGDTLILYLGGNVVRYYGWISWLRILLTQKEARVIQRASSRSCRDCEQNPTCLHSLQTYNCYKSDAKNINGKACFKGKKHSHTSVCDQI